jgi:hypothetical protein
MDELSAGPRSRYEVMWSVGERRGRIERSADLVPGVITIGALDKNFVKQFSALLTRLDGREVRVERRPLHSLDELCRVYPFRTERLETRQLRTELLPELRAMAGQGRFRTKYTPADNETHQVEQRLDARTLRKARSLWAASSPTLRACLVQHPRVHALLTRGEELFAVDSTVSCSESFAALVVECGPRLDQGTRNLLDDIMLACFPRDNTHRLGLLSTLGAFVSFPQTGTPSLLPHAIEALCDARSPRVQSIMRTLSHCRTGMGEAFSNPNFDEIVFYTRADKRITKNLIDGYAIRHDFQFIRAA